MADPTRLRDSTEIALPSESLDGIREDLESEFSITVSEEGAIARIIGSPVAIKRVNGYLARCGVALR